MLVAFLVMLREGIEIDRARLSGAVNTLAEDLSQLKGKLGLG